MRLCRGRERRPGCFPLQSRRKPSKMHSERSSRERGSVDISDLTEALRERFPEEFGDEPRENYSGLGATKDKFVRNLSQLEKASPEAHAAAVRAATSHSQAAALIRASMPAIEKALGTDATPEVFRKALVESRLQGLRQRWNDWRVGRAHYDRGRSRIVHRRGRRRRGAPGEPAREHRRQTGSGGRPSIPRCFSPGPPANGRGAD